MASTIPPCLSTFGFDPKNGAFSGKSGSEVAYDSKLTLQLDAERRLCFAVPRGQELVVLLVKPIAVPARLQNEAALAYRLLATLQPDLRLQYHSKPHYRHGR